MLGNTKRVVIISVVSIKGHSQDAVFIQHRVTYLWMATLSADVMRGRCQDADVIQDQATDLWMVTLSADVMQVLL